MMLFPESSLLQAHELSSNHKPELEEVQLCGCFFCKKIFWSNEIREWVIEDTPIDCRGTALCPYCGTDSVIGESSGFPITDEFMSAMNKYWF